MRIRVDLVGDDIEPLAGHGHRRPVGEMSAMGQGKAHDAVARLQEGKQDSLIGLGAGVGLHIGESGAE